MTVYNVLTNYPTWVMQTMATGRTFAGEIPSDVDDNPIEPTVSAGRADYKDLHNGGLFSEISRTRLPALVLQVYNPDSIPLDIARYNESGTLVKARDIPSTYPFVLAPGEILRASGGTDTTTVGFLVKLDNEQVL